MTDTTETSASAPADDIRARNKAIVFTALAEAGIRRVTVDYDGSGDSGQLESIEAWDAGNEKIPFPPEVKIQLALGEEDHPLSELALEAAVETLAWDYLDIYYGWQNNDGAFGAFVFSVPGRTVTLEHNERYSEVNTTSHEF